MKKGHKNLKQYLNKGISTPVGIVIILSVVIIVGGIITWQVWPEKEFLSSPPVASSTSTPTSPLTVSPTPTTTPSPTPSPSTPEPYIKIISPNGGEEWESGNTYEIKWQSAEIKNVVIDLHYLDSSVCTLAEVPAQEGRYFVEIDKRKKCFEGLSALRKEFKISVADAKGIPLPSDYYQKGPISDMSDNSFIIVAKEEDADCKTYTYTNKEYGYEIKYPVDFKLLVDSLDGELYLSRSRGKDVQTYHISVGKNLFTENQSPDARVFSEEENGFKKDYFIVYGGMGSWDAVINAYRHKGENYYMFSYSCGGNFGIPGLILSSGKKTTKQEIVDSKLKEMRDKNDERIKTFDQILSTFKFID